MITPETIALVKERTDIVALIGETVRLARRGRSFVGLCPFHQEKTPSFHVSPERAFFHCFGCKESGSAVDFLMKTEGQGFAEAIRALAERAGIAVAETTTDAEQREANAARRAKEELYAVNHLAATFFEGCLRGGAGVAPFAGEEAGAPHPLSRYAREELARRGLRVPDESDAAGAIGDALQAFRIGYAPYGWDGLATFLKRQGISPVTAERVGLLVPRSSGSGHYDRFRHRLMFAVCDVMGRVIAFSGRALPDPSAGELSAMGAAPQNTRGGDDQAPAKYMNSPESPIYTKGEHLFGLYQARHAIRQGAEAILVEGNFDVVALHARGVQNVVAPLGTAFTAAQAKLLKRFAPAVVVMFDGDAAGRKATRAARAACRDGELSARVARLPVGVDPDDLARKEGPEAIARTVKNARGMLEYLIDDALDGDGFKGATLTEQIARIRAVAKLLGDENDPNLASMAKLYADKLSSKLVIQGRSPGDLRQLEQIMQQAVGHASQSTSSAPRPVTGDRARSRSQVEEISLAVIGALLDFPELLADPEVEKALGGLEGEAALTIAAMRHNQTAEKGLYAGEFLAQIAPLIHKFAAGRLASPVFEAAHEAKAELLDNARKLKRLSLLRENAAVVDQLHRAEALGDSASEDALLREVERRSREKLGLCR
jgi:DNA primase